MKIVVVGGGAHRVLGIVRSALAVPGALEDGEICLVDLNPTRAEAMARILSMTPELRNSNTRIHWSQPLEGALEGASVVGVIMPALSTRAMVVGEEICLRHGFIASDNVSPLGSFCGVKIAPTLLQIARLMETRCPEALLVNFVNPVAVISGMINNHTRIRTLGVCQGFTNHRWDIARIFGSDEEADHIEVTAAGVNHLSYITGGTWKGGDLFDALRERLGPDWPIPELSERWSESARTNIQNSVSQLVRFWRELGVLIFSTEGDGMAHLCYEEAVEMARRKHRVLSADELKAFLASQAASRQESNRAFEQWAERDLDDAFWNTFGMQDHRFQRVDNDIFVRIFSALAGVREERIVTSRRNEGAIVGFKDREVVEYSQIISKSGISHDGPYEVPEVVQGLTVGLSAHQTLLGDALATEDPELLARALISYPINPFSRSSRAVFKDLLVAANEEISPALRPAIQFL
ncbi:MAG: hypothetical protein IAE94_14850 [Chthoniobacterales bacterium]|nr:hypothetical protein [Chthoniobacterales bacterium]